MCDHVMGQRWTGVSLSASLGQMWISMNADVCARCILRSLHDAASNVFMMVSIRNNVGLMRISKVVSLALPSS
jgi:hypothetical protein